jgi:hypothetical protein
MTFFFLKANSNDEKLGKYRLKVVWQKKYGKTVNLSNEL